MRDQELELIAALVEGRLEDETEARALIKSSPEHRAEYEAQKLAYEALRGAGTASLSEAERSALRRDIWTDLRSGVGTKPVRAPWYYRWAPVAAGLVIMVGLVTVLTQAGGGGDAATVAADLADSATTAADGAEGGAAVAPTSTASAMDESEGDGESASTFAEESAHDADDGADVADAADTALYAKQAARVREGDFRDERFQTYSEAGALEIESCLEEVDLKGYEIVALSEQPRETTGTTQAAETSIVVAAPENSDLATAPIAFVELETCEVVYLDE